MHIEISVPMYTNSAYRCAKHEKAVGGSGANHPKGMAWDGRIPMVSPGIIVPLAFHMGFTGVGIRAHGPLASQYVHLDTVHGKPAFWTYP